MLVIPKKYFNLERVAATTFVFGDCNEHLTFEVGIVGTQKKCGTIRIEHGEKNHPHCGVKITSSLAG